MIASASPLSFLATTLLLAAFTLPSAANALNQSTPIVDAAHVPTYIRNYEYHSAQAPFATFQSGTNLTQLPAHTTSHAYIVSDMQFLYSYNIANDSSTNRIINSTRPITGTNSNSVCSQAVLSPTSDSTKPDALQMYVVCTPNYIYIISANDTTGEFSVNFDSPIRVNFSFSSSTGLASSIPMLTGQVQVQQRVGGASPDLLLISGSGALFTIDSSTGQHARPQLGPSVTGLPTNGALTNIDFIVSSSSGATASTCLYCSATDSAGLLNAFVLTMSDAAMGEWNITYSSSLSGPLNSTQVQGRPFDTPNSVYYTVDSLEPSVRAAAIYRLDKGTLTLQSITITNSTFLYAISSLKSFYEPSPFNGIALAIFDAPNAGVYRLDFIQSTTVSLKIDLKSGLRREGYDVDSSSSVFVDSAHNSLYFVHGSIAVAELAPMITNSSINYVWDYSYIQDDSSKWQRYPIVNLGGSIMLDAGASGTNSIIVYSFWMNSSPPYGDELYIKVFTSQPSPTCQAVQSSSDVSAVRDTCYCEKLQGSATARSCVFDATTSSCIDVLQETYTPVCHPSSPNDDDEAGFGRLILFLTIFFIIIGLFAACCLVFGCLSLVKWRIDRNNRARASATNGAAPVVQREMTAVSAQQPPAQPSDGSNPYNEVQEQEEQV